VPQAGVEGPLVLPYELFLALRYLRVHRGRTFLSVITLISVSGVTVGTAALVIALSLMAGFVADVRERIYSGSAHLTVLGVDDVDPFPAGEALAARVAGVAGVAAAVPVLYSPALVTADATDGHGFAELHGIDPGGHARVILGLEDGGPFAPLEAATASGLEPIVLGHELAARLGVRAGDQVRVLVPQLTLAPWGALPRSRVYAVAATHRSDHFQEDSTRAYVRLAEARSLLRAEDGSSWIEVRLHDLRQLEPMKQQLRATLDQDWVVVDLIEQNRDILRALRTERLFLFLAIGLIVVVAALNIVSTLILMVTDKVKEIGTLTALGARPAGIARIFVLQGLVIGAVGTAAGLALGGAAAWWLDRYRIIQLNPEVYFLSYIPFDPQPIDLLVVGGASLAISLVATLYPAWKAARLDPLEAIRHE